MMAKIYYNRLYVGTITFDAIPESMQDKVVEIGKGEVVAGRLSVEHFEMLFKFPYEA